MESAFKSINLTPKILVNTSGTHRVIVTNMDSFWEESVSTYLYGRAAVSRMT